jgi:hypothetical protein
MHYAQVNPTLCYHLSLCTAQANRTADEWLMITVLMCCTSLVRRAGSYKQEQKKQLRAVESGGEISIAVSNFGEFSIKPPSVHSAIQSPSV